MTQQSGAKLIIESPSCMRIDGDLPWAQVAKDLTYTDKKVQFQLRRLQQSSWASAYQISELEKKVKTCLLFSDNKGYWTYPGFAPRLSRTYGLSIENNVIYPPEKTLPWKIKPEHEMHYYQKDSYSELINARHAAVELATGTGKTLILTHIIKNYGLKTLIMAPSISIAQQIHDLLVKAFDRKNVGAYFGSKKEYKKQIVVGIPQSLVNVKDGSPAFDAISQTEVFIADESHQCPAKTLASVCFGLVKDAPYRFFFSATQTRIDGLELLLEGITSEIVYQYSARSAIDEGFLAKPVFKIIKLESDDLTIPDDVNEQTRRHLYYNDRVLDKAASIANHCVKTLNHPVLILIDEIEQFQGLYNRLTVPCGFAHGTLTAENSKFVPSTHQNEFTPNELVEKFNNGEIPVLIGTSCISIGTDIRAVKTMIYLRGGKSVIEVKQSVGRCTRKVPGKDKCNVIDFWITNIPAMERHAMERKEIYEEISGDVSVV